MLLFLGLFPLVAGLSAVGHGEAQFGDEVGVIIARDCRRGAFECPFRDFLEYNVANHHNANQRDDAEGEIGDIKPENLRIAKIEHFEPLLITEPGLEWQAHTPFMQTDGQDCRNLRICYGINVLATIWTAE